MLQIHYNICCGIDVHKKILVATIADTNERKITTYETKQHPIDSGKIMQLVTTNFSL